METEKTVKSQILSNKFVPLILMVFNIYFFFYLLPIDIAEAYSIVLAIVGGVVTLVLSFWMVFTWIKSDELLDKIGVPFYLASIASLFVFGYFFIVKTSNFASDELAQNGVYTEAVIIDKTQIYGKRGRTTQNIDVRFVTQNNEQVNANILVDKKYYEYLNEGMTIPILYSSKYPKIAAIDYKKFRLE